MHAPGDHSYSLVSGGVFASLIVAALLAAPSREALAQDNVTVRYLAIQLFTGSFDSDQLRQSFPPSGVDVRKSVLDIRDRVGTVGTDRRKLGVVLGPISFDNSDQQVRALIRSAFDIAIESGVSIGFHIDDSMFWGRLAQLNSTESIEWLDWNRTPNTGRRLDWSATPLKVMPQLCLNSSAVRNAVAARAMLIGEETARGMRKLKAAGRENLFLGVIAGWETQIGRDFDTGKYLGYCALTNAGFSAKNLPADIDGEREKIVAEFIEYWSSSLVKAGVPRGKVFSHTAFLSERLYEVARRDTPSPFPAPYLRTINFTPPKTAFCASCVPGFSTYPEPGHLQQLHEELAKHGDPAWASSEGTPVVPSEAERPGSDKAMEGYLGNLFNHGAVLVNIFGWGVGDKNNPFRRTAESEAALAAYRIFLRGGTLAEAPLPVPVTPPPPDLPARVQRIQALLPAWVDAHGSAQVKPLMEQLDGYLKQQRFENASRTADEILRLISP
jgi:hypothetical protein